MFDLKAVVHAFYEDVWNRVDKQRIPALFHEDCTFRGSLGTARRGHAEIAAYVDFITTALSAYRCEIQTIVVEGDKAFAQVLFSGIHRGRFLVMPPTGARVSWTGAALFVCEGEKIKDLWVLGDVDGLKQQLGANTR